MKEYQENISEKTPEKVALKDEERISWRDVLGGKIMLNRKVTKHYGFILLVLFLCFVYIGIRLNNEDKVREIKKLEEIKKYQEEDFYRTQGLLNKEYSRDEVIYKLNKNQINLEYPDTPPFKY